MSRFWSDITRKIEPYVPGEQPGAGRFIKLNTNENPWPPSERVVDAIREAAGSCLRLYPDPECAGLKNACSKVFGVRPEEVFAGNGSDEVLAVAWQAFFMGRENVLIPDISYSFYPVYCEMYNTGYIPVPVREDFSINYEDYMGPAGGVVIANPNAPTSLALGMQEIEKIVAADPDRLVVIDEAYVDFGAESVLPLIKKYDNLLVVQTLSKSRSLAGLRVGFAFGCRELIEGMERIKNSFNSYTIDLLAQKGAEAAILDTGYFYDTRDRIITIREKTRGALAKMGFDVLDSKTNFLFIRNRSFTAQDIFQKLRQKNIIVRYFKKPRIDEWLRVTVGTGEEMEIFLNALKLICG